jgi:2-hydroxy-3-keto-5-methylthiopentenyl-1-phosphate phosphatase
MIEMLEDQQEILTDTLIITKRFRSPNEFSLYIEERVLQESISYMDAVIQYCEDIDIDVESVTKLINQSLKDKIQNEAEDQNYMRPRGKLPL